MIRVLALIVAFACGVAHAENDVFGMGDGHSGPLSVASGEVAIINDGFPLVADVARGATSLRLASTVKLSPGDLILLVQFVGLMPAPDAGVQDLIVIQSSVGMAPLEWARLATISGFDVTLTQPLEWGHRAGVTQVVRVPEYTTVDVGDAGLITAQPWNGLTGGIVALLASGVVTNNGHIGADARGFRGGFAQPYPPPGTADCSADAVYPSTGTRGEGVGGLFGATGTGNSTSGGGSGTACLANAGAGGGAHVRRGGNGAGGRGGAPLSYSMSEYLFPGGGGGGGFGKGVSTRGASGGGVVLVRSLSLVGSGMVTADGQRAGCYYSLVCAGGGAGGAVLVQTQGALRCRAAQASGVSNYERSSSLSDMAGGASGGRVHLTGNPVQCAIAVNPGASSDPDLGEPLSENDPRFMGEGVVNGGGFVVPAAPVLTEPIDGMLTGSLPTVRGTGVAGKTVRIYLDALAAGDAPVRADATFEWIPGTQLSQGRHRLEAAQFDLGVFSARSPARFFTVVGPDGGVGTPADAGASTDGGSSPLSPRLTSSPNTTGHCGVAYRYSGTRQPVVLQPGPYSYSLNALEGGRLPDGLSVDVATGEMSWTPTREDKGQHAVRLRVETPWGADEQFFVIQVECESEQMRAVACSVVASPLPWLLMGWFVLRKRRR